MGPGASKLKHLPVKHNKTRHGRPKTRLFRMRRGTGVQMAQPQKTKDNDRQNCTRASCLFVYGFYAQAPTKSPDMLLLGADEVQATRKSVSYGERIDLPLKGTGAWLRRK